MTLGELLGTPVHDAGGRRVGCVGDVRLEMTGPDAGPAHVHGLLVSRSAHTPFLGFERTGARAPWPVAQLLQWLHRDTFLVLWEDVADVGPDKVRLRAGARRWAFDLPGW